MSSITRPMHHRHNLNPSALNTIDDQVGADRPEREFLLRQIWAAMSNTRRTGEEFKSILEFETHRSAA